MTSWVVLSDGTLIPSFGAAQQERKMAKKEKTQYRTTKDIVIPAGTEISKEPPRTSKYATERATVLIEVTPDVTAEWHMDLEEAIMEGIVEPIDPAD